MWNMGWGVGVVPPAFKEARSDSDVILLTVVGAWVCTLGAEGGFGTHRPALVAAPEIGVFSGSRDLNIYRCQCLHEIY